MYKDVEEGKVVTHVDTDDARSGTTPHVARYVLGWGLALVIVAFIIILAIGMFTT
ncbi:MAG TPA: hypothetical protein VF475_08025 [Sphingobium sp.]